MDGTTKKPPGAALACAAIVLATLAVYWPVRGFDFVRFDDDRYVTENLVVRDGLTSRGVLWAFRTTTAANWHPVTWLSHMADVGIFGMWAGGHHLVNVALHSLNGVLLFMLLRGLTGRSARSALVALLFAVHPLHVESVAWVSERKDLLSTLFWILSIQAYLCYAKRPGGLRYLAVVALFAVALMAKPMPVTLPLMLLLLDWWPLGRMGTAPGDPSGSSPAVPIRRTLRLVLEKLPLLALSAISSAATFLAQGIPGSIASWEAVPLAMRVKNAAWSFLAYLGKTVWPAGLAVYYPHPGPKLSTLAASAAAAVVLALSAVAVRLARRRPYLPAGWFWFLGALVPVIGLVQVGGQAMADRYTYFPLVGIFVAATWGVSDVTASFRPARPAFAALAFAAAAALAIAARTQVGHWRDTESLFRHAVRVTDGNSVAHANLGAALASRGRIEEAARHLEEALRIDPADANAHNNLGVIRDDLGDSEGAIAHFRQAISANPGFSKAYANLGLTLARSGSPEEAVRNYRKALDLRPDDPKTHVNLAEALETLGDGAGAVVHLETAARLAPGDADLLLGLGVALARQGRVEDAARSYRDALRIRPGDAHAHFNLGVALLRMEDPAAAAERFRETLRIQPGYRKARVNLGIALAASGRLPEAIAAYEEALRDEPDDLKALNGIGAAKAGLGDVEGALAHFRRALRLRPDDPETRFNLRTAADLAQRRAPGRAGRPLRSGTPPE